MMRVRRLDHILLAMPAGRESDARKFYQEILGIPEAMKPAISLREVTVGLRTAN
jgi:4-hydroxyphenylpyruvate dioxygenase-like putative hemolysin